MDNLLCLRPVVLFPEDSVCSSYRLSLVFIMFCKGKKVEFYIKSMYSHPEENHPAFYLSIFCFAIIQILC